MLRKIIISHKGGLTCAAHLAGDELESFYREQDDNPQLVGNIYKGRVQNFLPGMRAAFIDIGRDKNVFIQTKEKLSAGQSVLVQIEKDAVGTKGARATFSISLAGRVLIFLPTLNYIGVSNKIRADERQRLHALAKNIRPKGAGLIVRTAAQGCDENILLADLANLQKLWENILGRYKKRKPLSLLYSDNDLLEKILRDGLTPDTEFIVDNLKIYRRLVELAPNVTFYEGSAQIFEAFGIAQEIANLDKRELPLPSGGQIVIDKTEALTAIDVNTSKSNSILKTNFEAAQLILKQLRLRNIGGIIIVDFIDMDSDAHKNALMNFLREQARRDRNKTKIIDMTPLGLVEITRQCSGR